MVEVPWDRLAASQPKVTEALVGMLILRLHPRAQAVDGSGGDGGRDLFEFTESGELINYEVKSFTGRMTPGRRNQVRDSLLSTARHQPDHWDLLVPINANPAEMKWFEDLRQEFPFVRNWRGLTWLNSHFAAHPDFVRYSLHSSSKEILDQIAEARAERDVLLRGVPDLADRFAALARRAQEISPHYGLHPTTGDDGASMIEIVPKSPHIPPEDLITVNGEMVFRTDDPEHARLQKRLRRVIRFGGDIELSGAHLRDFSVTAPPALGISGAVVPDSLRITSPRQPLDPPVRATLVVRQGAGLPAASLAVEFGHRTTGTAGGYFFGGDTTGVFAVRLRLDIPNRRSQFKMTFNPPERAMPHTYLPALRLIAQMLPGRSMELIMQGASESQIVAPVPGAESTGFLAPEEARQWADAFDDLARLQNLTSQFFPVPDGFTLGDAREVREALALLNGEHVQQRGSTVSVQVLRREAIDNLASGSRIRLAAVYSSVVFEFGDNRIDLGSMVEVITADRVTNLSEAQRQFDSEGQATVRMSIAQGTPPVRYLGSEPPV